MPDVKRGMTCVYQPDPTIAGDPLEPTPCFIARVHDLSEPSDLPHVDLVGLRWGGGEFWRGTVPYNSGSRVGTWHFPEDE